MGGACSGTTWRLFRPYWVLFKLLMTVFATIILLQYLKTFRLMAGVVVDSAVELATVRNASPALHSTLAMNVLLIATVFAVYKPRGVTRYGWRKHQQEQQAPQPVADENRG